MDNIVYEQLKVISSISKLVESAKETVNTFFSLLASVITNLLHPRYEARYSYSRYLKLKR